MGISSSIGLISGLETESIITSMMNLERAPITQLQQKQAEYQAKISSFGMVKSALSSLKSAVSALSDTDNFAPGFSATSSNEDILGVSVSDADSVSAGKYTITVNQLATSAQMTSNTYTESDSTVGSGTLHFQVGDGDKQSISIDSDNQSLSDIATLINEADIDVSASVIRVSETDYRLSITANDTGKDISYTFQEEGFTFETTTQAGASNGEIITSEGFASDSTALGLTGTLSINGNDIALTGTETLNDIQASVDALADISAQVTFDSESGTYSLEIENDTAEGNVDLNFSDSDSASGLSELIDDSATIAAKKALLTINNIAGVERDSNTIDDLIDGLTLNLNDEDVDTSITVSVSENYNTASSKLSSFVEAYNSAFSTLENLQLFAGDEGTSGNLLGDGTAKILTSGLQRMIFSSSDGISLSSLGVEVGEDSLLTFDSGTFSTEMKNDPEAVTDFFTLDTSSSTGLAVGFEDFLDGYLDTSDGILQTKIDGYTRSSEKIDDTIESMELRLNKREATMRKQYQSLELLLSNYTSTASYLSSQLEGLSNLSKSIYG